MNIRKLAATLLCIAGMCSGQGNSSKTVQLQQGPLTQQNPPVVPDIYELGRRAGITEEDHTRLGKVETKVDDIGTTISWMRGAWWMLGGALALAAAIAAFFGSSILVAIDHRMERARTEAMSQRKTTS
jgi:hypothetical protein